MLIRSWHECAGALPKIKSDVIAVIKGCRHNVWVRRYGVAERTRMHEYLALGEWVVDADSASRIVTELRTRNSRYLRR